MTKYELTPDLMTGHPLIDSQHKELFSAINNLMDACALGKGRSSLESTFNFLQNYIIKHFGDEEKLQLSVSYPEYSRHKAAHEEYKKLSQKAGDILIKEGATFTALTEINKAVAVLINHVKIEDKKIANHIKNTKK